MFHHLKKSAKHVQLPTALDCWKWGQGERERGRDALSGDLAWSSSTLLKPTTPKMTTTAWTFLATTKKFFQRSSLFVVDSFEANNPKNDDYCQNWTFLATAVVVAFGVVGLRRVDEGQSGSLEMSSVACSSEIKEDGLRFVERQHDDHQPQSCWFWEQRTAT